MKSLRSSAVIGVVVLLAACGGGGGGGSGFLPVLPYSEPQASVPPPATGNYTVGGTVAGLVGTLVLQNNAGDDIKLTADGKFTFSTPLGTDGVYDVKVETQPLWQFCVVTKGGGTAAANVFDVSVACAAAVAQVTTLAGIANTPSSVDGSSMVATFNSPSGIAIGKDGTFLVTEGDHVRKITANGDVTTFAGSGASTSTDGNGTLASFAGSFAIAVAPSGDAYVVDFQSSRIRKVTPTADVSTFAGNGLSVATVDGIGTLAGFKNAQGVAVDAAGFIYVVEIGGNVVRQITPAGAVTTLAGSGTSTFADALGSAASFNTPSGIAVDSAGNLFVADQGNRRIRKITPKGDVTTFAGTGAIGTKDGAGDKASFLGPMNVAVDSEDNLYLTDASLVRRITPAGVVTKLAGQSGLNVSQNGVGAAATFVFPLGIAVDKAGTVYVTDIDAHLIRKITPIQAP